MDVLRARRAMAIMADALDLPKADREEFVAGATDDGRVRAEVRSLLAAHDEGGEFLVAASEGALPEASTHHAPPRAFAGMLRRIADFELLDLLGSGGMGTVYLAQQDSPRRRVALKVLAGPWTPDRLARFELESEALGRLRHPGIAVIYQTGVDHRSSAALPYFALELVEDALPITEFAGSAGLDLPATLRLIQQVCAAVSHGHQKGVIHRDLKPSNILVDRTGQPKIIDFGIARVAGAGRLEARLTRTGCILGTPAYMSPEQWLANADAVDVRTDVYALGAVLYEMICGRWPIEPGSGVDSEQDSRWRQPARPRAVLPSLPRDVETILMTAMEVDPARRYASVAAMSADIGRFLAHRPIEARPVSTIRQVSLFAHRHRAALTATVLAALGLVFATVMSLGFALQTGREAIRRGAAEADAIRHGDEATTRTYLARIAAAEASLHAGECARLRENLEAAPEALRGWEWHHLSTRVQGSELVLAAHPRRVFELAADPDGAHLWSVGDDGAARSWTRSTGVADRSFSSHKGEVRAVAVSSAGDVMATAGEDRRIVLRDMGTGGERVLKGHKGTIHELEFSSDGTLLASGGADRLVNVWRVADGALLATLARAGAVYALAFAGPESLVVAGHKQDAELVRIADGAVLQTVVHTDQDVMDMSWLSKAGAGGVLLLAVHDWTARAVEISDDALPPHELLRLEHPGNVWTVAGSADGRLLATGCGDMGIRVWRVADGALLAEQRGHEENIHDLLFDADGTRLWSAGWDGTVRTWRLDGIEERQSGVPVLKAHSDTIQAVAFSPDGSLLASGGRDGRICLWDVAGRRLRREWRPLTEAGVPQTVWSLAFSPDGGVLASGLNDGTVALWRASDGARLEVLRGHRERVYGVAFAPDGAQLASGSLDRTARVWNLDGQGRWWAGPVIPHPRLVWAVAFHPAGDVLATASWDQTVRLIDPASGSELAAMRGHSDGIYGLAFSPDGSLLASGGRDRRVIVWDVASRRERWRLEGHGQFITGLAFLPDGSRLVASSWFGRVLLWGPIGEAGTLGETEAPPLLLSLRAAPTSSPRGVAVDREGTTIATGGRDRTLWLWRATE